jgi:uncharacterized delta-60 repeat protein
MELPDFGSQSDAWANAVAVQPDGKIVVAGALGPRNRSSGRLALFRFTRKGTLDPAFGKNGKALTPDGQASAVAIQPGGKILAAGYRGNGFALTRFTARGNLDRTFGSGGRVLTGFRPGSSVYATALAIQPDGKFVVAGQVIINAYTNLALVRYRSNGRLDPSFGNGGRVLARVGTPSTVLIQRDGKIVVVAGKSLLRYGGDGTLDPSFGVDGKVTNIPGVGNALAIQADGKLVVAGTGEGRCNCEDPRVFMIARWTSDGSPDLSFGRGGKITTAFRAGATADGVAVVGARKIVASGTVGGKDFALARYTSSGKLDGSFGNDGKIVTDFSSVWARRR